MQISERSKSLQRAIPSAISELSEAMDDSYVSYSRKDEHKNACKAAAWKYRLLAQALLAAATEALLNLEPRPPENHYHGAPRLSPLDRPRLGPRAEEAVPVR